MNPKLLSEMLRNVQRLGEGADILTGLVAAGFSLSPSFTRGFYAACLAEAEGERGDLLPFPETFAVRVGEKIGKKNYEWIEDKRITFAPDIWIFDAAAPGWDHNTQKPAPSFQFFIECKDHGVCTKGQLRGYPFVRKDLFANQRKATFTLLICDTVTAEEAASFSCVLHWSDYLAVAREVSEHIQDATEKSFVVQFLAAVEAQMNPDMNELSSDRISDALAAQGLAAWLRSRLPCEGSITPLVDPPGKGGRNSAKKTLTLAGDRRTGLSLDIQRSQTVFRLELVRTKDAKIVAKAQTVELTAETPAQLIADLLANLRGELESYLRHI